jgi:hypothetical protein
MSDSDMRGFARRGTTRMSLRSSGLRARPGHDLAGNPMPEHRHRKVPESLAQGA